MDNTTQVDTAQQVEPTKLLTSRPSLSLAADPADTYELVKSLLPFSDNDFKAKYISYRASGFSFREACEIVGIHEKTVHRWRVDNPEFVIIEEQLPELRKTLGIEYARMEFLRNYRLILKKDFDVIKKSIDSPDEISSNEQSYLLKARTHYTPQQLEVLQKMLGLGNAPVQEDKKQWDFAGFITSMSRTSTSTTETIEIKKAT